MTVARRVVDGQWLPDLDPPDNRPGGRVRPRWHLLLDHPVPQRVLAVGPVDPDVEAWLVEVGATVRHVGRVGGLPSPADLVVVGSGEALAHGESEALAWLARCCGEDGAMWLPGRRSVLRDRHLRAHGFPVRRWTGSSGAPWNHPVGRGVVACRRGPAGRPPTWLAALGQRAGWDGEAGTWSLSTPTAYPSQKTVARLGPPTSGGASLVVKATQHPRFNGRLDNEGLRLRQVAAAGDAARRRVPALHAAAQVGGLTAVVEEGLVGRPFLEVSRLRPDCPVAADAVAAITAVGQATRTTSPGHDLTDVLAPLVERFASRYRPPSVVEAFLWDQLTLLADAPRLPTVMFHGDLGTWNLLVVDGRVRILDWESAGSAGPPLWDLAYFLRSYAIRSGRRRGRRRDGSVTRHLVEGSPLTVAFQRWIRHHCSVLEIEPHLVAPLFHLCWVHRAVKEASRLAPDRSGHYGPLCVRLVEERDAPGLRRLLEG